MTNTKIPIQFIAALGAMSCGAEATRTRPVAPIVTEAPADPIGEGERERSLEEEPRGGSLVVDPELVELCDLPTAHFDFDRSALGAEVSGALDLLVACLSDVPLKGRALSLVGHADERGGTTYNQALGQRRADSVANYMRDHGLRAPLRTSSRGESEAEGVDALGWARDRKVVILLER